MLFIGVFDGSVLLYFLHFKSAGFIEKEIWDINQFLEGYKDTISNKY